MLFNIKSTVFSYQLLLVLLAILLSLIKLAAWRLTNSLSILTDLLESLINIVAALFSLFSIYWSKQPQDENHPYGHGKIEFIAAIIEGSLILMAGLAIIGKVFYSYLSQDRVLSLELGLWLVLGTALLNMLGGYYGQKIGVKHKSPALVASAQHLKVDSYSTFIVVIGLLIAKLSGQLWLDYLLALVLASYIIYSGFMIVRQAFGGIMDEADKGTIQKLVDCLQKNRRDNWVDLHNVRFIRFGGHLHLDCHLTLPWYFSLREAHKEIDKLQELLDDHFKEELDIFIHTDDCQPYACSVCSKDDCPFRRHIRQKKLRWNIDNITSIRRHSL